MNFKKYLPFGWGRTNNQQDIFDDLREFIYLDELSVRSLLAATGEGGIPVESTTNSMDETTKGANMGVSGPAGPASVNYQSVSQTSTGLVSSLQAAQSKFTQLYQNERVEKSLSSNKLADQREEDDLSNFALSEFDRGDIIEVQVTLRPNLLFRLYRVLEYVYTASPNDISPDAEQNLSLIQETIGNSIPVVGTMTDYKWSDSTNQSLQSLPLGQVPAKGSEAKLVTELDIQKFRGDPIRTLSEEDQFIMFCRIESVDPNTWYPLKITQVLDTFPGNAAEVLNEEMEQALEKARKEISAMAVESNTYERTFESTEFIIDYSLLIEEKTQILIEEDARSSMVEEAIAGIDQSQDYIQSELKKNLLKKYTQIIESRYPSVEVSSDVQLELRNQVLEREDGQAAQVVRENSDRVSNDRFDDLAFKVKPVAIYW